MMKNPAHSHTNIQQKGKEKKKQKKKQKNSNQICNIFLLFLCDEQTEECY